MLRPKSQAPGLPSVQKILDQPQYGDVMTIWEDVVALLLPPTKISVTECAIKYRKIPIEGGGVKPWNKDLTPYMVDAQDSLDDINFNATVIVGPGQCAKTTAAENWFLKTVLYDPMSMLWYMHEAEALTEYLEQVFVPFMDLHPDVANKLTGRREDNTRYRKRFSHGMLINWLTATKGSLISKKAPRIIVDEIDALKDKIGDVKSLTDVRKTTYGKTGSTLITSHPDKGWDGGCASIWKNDSDRRIWYWPCPACGMVSTALPYGAKGRIMTLEYDLPDGYNDNDLLETVYQSARLNCPSGCGAVIVNSERRAMNLEGAWIGDGETPNDDCFKTGELTQRDTAGFWIHGFNSNFIDIGDLARDYVKQDLLFQRTQKSSNLREVVVKRFGEVFEGADFASRPLRKDELKSSSEGTGYKMKTVPEGVRFLVAAVDTHGSSFEVGIIGYGADNESWLIDRYAIKQWKGFSNILPGKRVKDWDVLDIVLASRYPLVSNPDLEMPIATLGVDQGGVKGVTHNSRLWMRKKLAAGYEEWQIRLIKGGNNKKAEDIVGPKYIEHDDKGNKLEPKVPEYILNVYELKNTLFERLKLEENEDHGNAGVIHFPEDTPDYVFRELTAEKLEDGEWKRRGPNETWDQFVYSIPLGLMLGPDRPEIDWENNPPVWATPIDTKIETIKSAPAKRVRVLKKL